MSFSSWKDPAAFFLGDAVLLKAVSPIIAQTARDRHPTGEWHVLALALVRLYKTG
jgi:hypothetical protein